MTKTRNGVDWGEIQLFHAQGHSVAECRRVFGFSKSAWDSAALRGDVHYIRPVYSGEASEKRCPKCERILPIDHFHRRDHRRHAYCKDCQKIVRSASYYKNRTYYRGRIKQRQEDIARWLWEYKSTLSCVRCGFSHPAALHFHRRDPEQKRIEMSLVAKRKGWGRARIHEELAKCDPLCANCHFILHWEERRAGTKSGAI